MRSNFFRFGAFWLFQLMWVWIVSLPVTVLNSPNISALSTEPIVFGSGSDAVGLIFYIIGMLLETLGDWQKFQWKARTKGQPGLPVCRTGVWKWSRHPVRCSYHVPHIYPACLPDPLSYTHLPYFFLSHFSFS
jgi:steroid 5-alpha reductase family enzyme